MRRFTGGGTVVLAPGICLCSLVLRDWPVGASHTAIGTGSVDDSRGVAGGGAGGALVDPRAIMSWSEGFYRPLLGHLAGSAAAESFRARENDYVLGDLKFAGNAQAITRG